jgi:hypothetical protein
MRRALLAAGVAALLLGAPSAGAASTIAVIGDIPYGDALIAEFPADIAEINADPSVGRVVHLGDIKNGSTRCDTSYFRARLADFQTFEDPLVYTPGDNEWTDCHRANNGAICRPSAWTPSAGCSSTGTAGRSASTPTGSVTSPIGSPRTCAGATRRWCSAPSTGQPQPETRAERAARSREYSAREAAALAWIDATFDSAERHHAAAVAIGMQADMWDSSAVPAELTAFEPIKAVPAERAERFGKPVLLLEGDSHLFKVDTPADMPANLTRVVVEGSTNTPHEWLRLHMSAKTPQVFSCENVTFQTGLVTPCPAPLAPFSE